jgi:hypothetical protein
MDRAADLRHRAGLYKRLAQIRTSGGHSTDLLLLSLADELDREAAELETNFRANRDGPMLVQRDAASLSHNSVAIGCGSVETAGHLSGQAAPPTPSRD